MGCLPPERAKNCGEEYQQIKFAFEKTILPFVDQEQMAKVRERQWFQPAELPGTTAFKSLPFCNDFGAKRRDKMCRRGITKILGWEMRWLTIFLAACLAAGAGYYYWLQQAEAKLDIQTVAATRADVRRAVSTSGTVRALGTVDIGSQLSGNIGELNVDFTSEVKKGQVLARIEPSTFETKVREEEAGLAIAEANVDLQQATVERAESNLHKAELDLHRAQELVTKGAGTQVTLDAAIAGQQSTTAELAIAKANVENAKATLAQHQATLDSARINLERTYIRSPIDGVVIDRTVEVGQTVAASLQAPKLFTIAQDLSHVQIEAQVDEADIGQIASDNAVSFTVDAYPDVTFQGKVTQIRLAPVALNNVVTYTVVIDADNPFGRLLPGMTANVEIVTGEHKGVVTVPNEALRYQATRAGASGAGARRAFDRHRLARRARQPHAGTAQD